MTQQIESGEEPFVPDPNDYNESGEPAYMKEWSTAEDSIDILGQTAVSMLASSLHVYLVEWVEQDHGMGTVERYKQHNKVAFRDGGWFGGIRSFFMECRGIK